MTYVTAVTADDIHLDFPVYQGNSLNFRSKLVQFGTGGIINVTNSGVTTVKALHGISFKCEAGDRIGLIGHNGAGKTTLLRLLGGIYEPTSGSLSLNGTVSCLINLSLGMDFDATGYQNLVIAGTVLGLDRGTIKKLTTEVEEFTELGNYLNLPLRTYSQGMLTRLSFFIASSIEPDVLLIDEGMDAGDAHFFEKARARLETLLKRTNNLFMATHNFNSLRQFCSKAMVLNHGRLTYFGDVEDAIKCYMDTPPV